MARFEFNLETALEQRRRVERERQTAVARLEQARLSAQGRVAAVQQRLVQEREQMRSMLGGGAVPVSGVRLQATAGLRGIAELRALAVELAGVYKRLETARAELLSAAVARKAVEKLRDKQLARWKSEQERRESAELDDLTLMRAAQNAAGVDQ